MEQTLTESYVVGRPTSGEQVGNYLLLRELGRGGYAQVYLAEHLYFKHLVALKLLNLSLNQHEDLVRFQFEARLLAQLQHRHCRPRPQGCAYSGTRQVRSACKRPGRQLHRELPIAWGRHALR